MQLSGKRVIVTGGAMGIGGSAVRAFAREGATVASLDIQSELGVAVAAEATRAGPGKVSFRTCDVVDREQVRSVFAEAVMEMGGLDALVAVAGVEKTAPAEDIAPEDWDLMFDVSARGTFNTNQAAFPYLKERGGRIVNFGSGAGLTGMPGGAHYSAAKGAVLAWTRTIAQEWGRYGICCNAVAPGMHTPMYDKHRAAMTAEQLVAHDEIMKGLIPLGGKLGDPNKDMAPMLVFLLTDGSGFITAQTLCVSGGLDILT